MTNRKQLPPVTERSYGILALRHTSPTPPNDNTPSNPSSKNTQILLILQKTLSRSTFWTFPKGHAEADDASVTSTAIRELQEETSISITRDDILTFPWLPSVSAVGPGEDGGFAERYVNPMRRSGKEVRYWVALVPAGSDGREQVVRVQEREVADARWCAWDEGEGLLEFEEGKEVLRAARTALDGLGGEMKL